MAYKRKRSFKKKTYKRKSYAKKKKPLKKVIQQVINRTLETKTRTWGNLGNSLWAVSNAAAFDGNNVFPLGCQAGASEIVQGTGNGFRIGNSITIKKLTMKGTVIPNPYNVTTNAVQLPTQVKLWFFYAKDLPNSIPTPATSADFFDLNNAVTTFHNDLVDMWAPINTDRYRVLGTRTMKIGFSNAEVQTAGNTAAQYNLGNNDFKLNQNFSVDLTKMLPRHQKYVDNNMNAVTRQIYCMACPLAGNGSAFPSTYRPVTIQWQATMWYQDA